MKGILGRKLGMTQLFDSNNKVIPITVIDVAGNIVTQVKTIDTDGYNGTQLSFSDKKEQRVNKPLKGHFNKAKSCSKYYVKEIRDMQNFELGKNILGSDIFKEGEIVDVTSISRGHGFSGSIKRNNQSRGPMGHGSGYHRGVGSMGAIAPNRILKGKALPGQYGNTQVTIQNLQVVKIDDTNNIILIKGVVPGPKNSYVTIKTSIKHPEKIVSVNIPDKRELFEKHELIKKAISLKISISKDMTSSEIKKLIDDHNLQASNNKPSSKSDDSSLNKNNIDESKPEDPANAVPSNKTVNSLDKNVSTDEKKSNNVAINESSNSDSIKKVGDHE